MDWRRVDEVVTSGDKLDVDTDRVLAYQLINTADGRSTVTSFDLHLHDGLAQTALRPFFGPKLPADAMSDYRITPRGYMWSPTEGAVPGVMMLFDALPDGPVGLGTTWGRHRPTDEEAGRSDSLVQQSIRNFEVVDAWDTPQGMVIRVHVDGYVRWFDNEYRRRGDVGMFDFDTTPRPEHTGYVDVNLTTGTVLDAMVYVDVASTKLMASDLVGPRTRIMRLCPAREASFTANADTCS
ncbi:MAG: hypothetical protein K0V04_06775 [Deltaproteobacteria bacterium]|nr:hypothetical protein [Deltaproteobacteria bacterium]